MSGSGKTDFLHPLRFLLIKEAEVVKFFTLRKTDLKVVCFDANIQSIKSTLLRKILFFSETCVATHLKPSAIVLFPSAN